MTSLPTLDDFFLKYLPIVNPNPETRIFETERGFLGFETYGKDLDYVLSIANSEPRKVWTLCDSEDGGMHLSTGYHLVNRICYFISDRLWTDEYEQFEEVFFTGEEENDD